MSQRRIKKTVSRNGSKESPLDWIRTDDKSMMDAFYIYLLTRGLYPVLEALEEAIGIEAEASRYHKAEFHPGWNENADFCEEVIAHIRATSELLHQKWKREKEDDLPNTARRKTPTIGGFYPLPGGGIYVPKKGSFR